MLRPKDIDVLILCGGRGSRLRSVVSDRPKPMAEINQQPFLDALMGYLFLNGFRRFVLSTGYMAASIRRYYQKKEGRDIRFCEESAPLGTGGALKKAGRFIKSGYFLALNGDSFCKVDFKKFLAFHNKKKGLASIVVAKNKQNRDCGSVKLDGLNRIISFREKEGGKNRRISAGIYLFDRKIFSLMPKRGRFSLEYELFPKLNGKGFYGYMTDNTLVDIGTPDGLKKARLYFKRTRLKK